MKAQHFYVLVKTMRHQRAVNANNIEIALPIDRIIARIKRQLINRLQ